jgi:hypothetical protein
LPGKRNRQELKPSRRWYHRAGVPFNEFRQTKPLFRQFVAGDDWTTNDRFDVMDGTLCVDYMIRYERLSDDLAEVCRRVGLPAITLPHLKSGMRRHIRMSTIMTRQASRSSLSAITMTSPCSDTSSNVCRYWESTL